MEDRIIINPVIYANNPVFMDAVGYTCTGTELKVRAIIIDIPNQKITDATGKIWSIKINKE